MGLEDRFLVQKPRGVARPARGTRRAGLAALLSSPLPPTRYSPLVTASSFGYYDFFQLQLRHKIVLAFFSLFLLTEQVFYLFLRFSRS